MIEKHGIEAVSEATGYSIGTLVQVGYGVLRRISLERLNQAEYVFKNLE